MLIVDSNLFPVCQIFYYFLGGGVRISRLLGSAFIYKSSKLEFTVHTGFIPVNILLLLQTNCFIITSYNIIYTYIQWLLLRRVEYLFPFFNSFSENWHFKRYQIFLFRLIFYKKWDFFYSLTFRNFTWVHLNLLKKLSDRYY